MIDIASANIYSFASGARNQLQSEDFLDKLLLQYSKVADFLKRINISSAQQKAKAKAGLILEPFQKLFAPNQNNNQLYLI
jgi:hypothetical protein